MALCASKAPGGAAANQPMVCQSLVCLLGEALLPKHRLPSRLETPPGAVAAPAAGGHGRRWDVSTASPLWLP